MAFNKLSILLLLLLVSSAIATARLFENEASAKPEFCTSCECTVDEYGKTKCTRRDQRVGGCPVVCRERSCGCNRMNPPTCWCFYEVDTCSPSACNASPTLLVDALGLN